MKIIREDIKTLLFSAMLISYYLEPAIFIGNSVYIPSAFSFIIFAVILLVYGARWRKSDLHFFAIAAACAIASAGFSSLNYSLGPRLSGVIQISAAIITAIGFFRFGTSMSATRMSSIMGWCMIILMFLAFVEVAGFLTISDSFRNLAYSQGGYGVYAADDRDLALAGFIRPKVFTSEPSLLAIGYTTSALSWLMLSPSMRRFALVFVSGSVMAYLTGSPIAFGGLLLAVAVYVIPSLKGARSIFLYGILGTALLAILFATLGPVVATRFENIFGSGFSYERTSENLRLVFPFYSALETLKEHPIWGLGIGGKRSLDEVSSLGVGWEAAFGNNNIAALLISMGAVGGLIFLINILTYSFKTCRSPLTFVLCATFLSLSMGGFETVRYWGYLFLLLLALFHQHKTNASPTRKEHTTTEVIT